MMDNETPEALLKFFSDLDPGDAGDEACSIHYGCLCVLKKGRRAAEMLVALQNGNAAGAPPAHSQLAGALDRALAVVAGLKEELAAEKKIVGSLGVENSRLSRENQLAQEKIRNLHRQINRLYDIREMTAIHSRLQYEGPEKEADETGEASEEAGRVNPELIEEAATVIAPVEPAAGVAGNAGKEADIFMDDECAARVTDAKPTTAPPAEPEVETPAAPQVEQESSRGEKRTERT